MPNNIGGYAMPTAPCDPDELTETVGRRLRITLPEGVPGVAMANGIQLTLDDRSGDRRCRCRSIVHGRARERGGDQRRDPPARFR